MTSLQERLFAMQDKQYAAFQAKLTPGVPMESFIGIRVPVLRKFAKEFTKEADCEEFLHQLPHEYYDENMLHGLLISEVKDYEECIRLTEEFLPFVDNWAVCDIMSPKVFANVFAARANNAATSHDYAVVMNDSTQLSAVSREPLNKDEVAFTLHEGAKLKKNDSIRIDGNAKNTWYKVQTADNREAWIKASAIEEI